MHQNFNIRNLYHPIQPTIKQSATNVTYAEFLPDIGLQPFVYCYWQLKTSQPLTNFFNYRVVADGCIDIFFDLYQPKESFVMVFCKKYTEFPLESSFNYIGIRFLPTMLPQLFKIDASLLSNKAVELDLILPQVSKFIANNFDNAVPIESIINQLDKFFINHLAKTNLDLDNRLCGAVELILKNCGVIRVEEIDANISQRQLRRLFDFYIGDTPKTFSKVIRFQQILRAKPSTQSLKQNKVFFDTGYYDQAHFIKDFKNLYGVTPSKAFGR